MHGHFLSLCLMDCWRFNILYVSMCKKAAASIIFSKFFWRKKTEKNTQMFSAEQRSWWVDMDTFAFCWVFTCFLSFCSETSWAAAEGSVKQTLSGCFSRRSPGGSSPSHLLALLRPPGEQASWGPWSVWPSKSFHHWTVRPLFCRSGTCWETRWVWSGSSAGCPGWAASCWGWPQTPGRGGSGWRY